jgi:hypothetical protein
MDKIKVIPLKEFANVKFGMKREEVRKELGDAKEFKKTKYSKVFTDDFGFCHVYYDEKDTCEAVEFFGDVEVFVNGEKVFPGSINDCKAVFTDLFQDGDDYTSTEYSVGIYAPNNKMESILFGVSGYYE